MKFRLKADCTFDADDIDDAFRKMEEHFDDLASTGLDVKSLDMIGEISIEPEKVK